MATFKEHCEDCEREFGAAFEDVHRWLDELQPEYGPFHRKWRHHAEGVERIRAMWGDAAALAAEIHIRRDCLGTIPTSRDYRDRDVAAEGADPDLD